MYGLIGTNTKTIFLNNSRYQKELIDLIRISAKHGEKIYIYIYIYLFQESTFLFKYVEITYSFYPYSSFLFLWSCNY